MDLPALAVSLRTHVTALASAPRVPGTPEHRRARDYIRGQLQRAGFEVDEVVRREAGLECLNLLTRPIPDGSGRPRVIIGAHYDSVPASPGADDNGSAVAALLELGRWIRPRLEEHCPTALQLAAYDLEEYGLVGSAYHCRDLQQEGAGLRGMISLEMLGYTDARPGSQRLPPHLAAFYPDVANFIGIVGNEASRFLLQAVVGKLKEVPGLPVEFIAVPGKGELLPESRLSDHSSFWDRGHPALMITDTSFFRNPHYHQSSDTPETLDYPFLARVTLGVCTAALFLGQQE